MAAAEAGVTVMATEACIDEVLGTLEAAGARGVAGDSLLMIEPLRCWYRGEYGLEGMSMARAAE